MTTKRPEAGDHKQEDKLPRTPCKKYKAKTGVAVTGEKLNQRIFVCI